MGDRAPFVLLAPSYGNPKTVKRYRDTIEGSIDFTQPRYAELLTPEQLTDLQALHPSGSAHFWGAIATHNKTMDSLRTGDVVVFTGGKKVRAAGEIGHLFRNEPFADLMWDQYAEAKSFVNVYTVRNVQEIDRPYEDLWSLEGFNHGDNIMGQRLIADGRAERILSAFGIGTSWAEESLSAQLEAVRRSLEGGSRVVEVEHAHVDVVRHRVTEREAEYERVESLLVRDFQARHPAHRYTSFVTPSGKRADLYRAEGDRVEVIEAKSLATHEMVRQAAAQLLDYAVDSPKPVTVLTALFPAEPSHDSIAYLNRLGIDCVFRTEEGFPRKPASEVRRRYMLPVWRGNG
jgi:hypothetical protein